MSVFKIPVDLTLWAWKLLALWAIASTIFLSLELAIGPQSQIPWIAAVLVLIIMIFFKWRLANCLSSTLIQCTLTKVDAISGPTWYGTVFIIGIGLRVVWLLASDVHLLSDGATYFGLAGQLLEQGTYLDPRGDLAYWPPGYPIFLMPFHWLMNGSLIAVFLANLLLYIAIFIVAVLLAYRFGDDLAGRLVALMIAIWPNLVLLTVVGSKEMVLTLLLPLALLVLYGSPIKNGKLTLKNGFQCIVAGAILGFATLVQPSFMLIPIALFLAEWLGGARIRNALIRTLLMVMALVAVVAPWSMRNAQVLGQMVPVSTNGGDVFYRANNPLANGGYLAKGEVDLSHLPELERSREGFRLGLAWIKNYPVDFLQLAVRKQVLFLGDDSTGAYESMKRGRESTGGGRSYPLIKALCNAFWLVLWIAVFFSISRRTMHSTHLLLLMAIFAYPLAIDSIFESDGRHHIPVVVILAIVAAAGIARLTKPIKLSS